jgi:hypothetical protein
LIRIVNQRARLMLRHRLVIEFRIFDQAEQLIRHKIPNRGDVAQLIFETRRLLRSFRRLRCDAGGEMMVAGGRIWRTSTLWARPLLFEN